MVDGHSNLEILLGKVPSARYIVRSLTSEGGTVHSTTRIYAGALNWATGETVAVKEIQLANIPKAELGEIMVRYTVFTPAHHIDTSPVRNRSIEEPKCVHFICYTSVVFKPTTLATSIPTS